MAKPTVVLLAVGALGLSLAGCAKRPGPEPDPGAGETAASPPSSLRRVALHVKGMAKIGGIT